MKDAATIAGECRTQAMRLRDEADQLIMLADTLVPTVAKPKRRQLRVQAKMDLPELDAHRKAKLRVLSSTKPTPEELVDRDVVHTTGAPREAS